MENITRTADTRYGYKRNLTAQRISEGQLRPGMTAYIAQADPVTLSGKADTAVEMSEVVFHRRCAGVVAIACT